LPHYAAPITGLIFALILLAMQHLRTWAWRGRAAGLFIVRASIIVSLIMPLVRVAGTALRLPVSGSKPETCCSSGHKGSYRVQVEAELNARGTPQLVLVRYGLHHNRDNEWVFNKADIDRSLVIWARDMGAEKNKELLEYYKDREVWLVEPDENPPQLSPYQTELGSTASAIQVPAGDRRADH
jgi:hypothetical protein